MIETPEEWADHIAELVTPDGRKAEIIHAIKWSVRAEHGRLKAINADLLAALEFYANPDIVIGRIIDGKIVAEPENNETARAAIAKATDSR